MDDALRIGDDDTDGSRLQCGGLQMNLLLREFPFGHVAGNALDSYRLPVFVKDAGANFHRQPRTVLGKNFESNVVERLLLVLYPDDNVPIWPG